MKIQEGSARLRGRLSVAVIGLALSLPAQWQGSSALERKPPFEDAVLHDHMVHILRHMDGFNADSSMHWISTALLHVDGRDQPEALYYLLSYRAEVLYYEGLFNEAMQDLDRCGPLADGLRDSMLVANLHNLKGLLHENIQESREALPHLQQALAWFPARPAARYPLTELHHIHGNLGSFLMHAGALDSAGQHLLYSLELAIRAGAARAISVAHWSLGSLALQRDLPDSAMACFQRSVRVAEEANEHDVLLDGLAGLAQAELALGDHRAVHAALLKGEQHQRAHPDAIGLATRRNFARRASNLYRTIGDTEAALAAIGDWHRMDSTISARNTRTALSTQAELLRSDGELAVERLQRERYAEALEHVRTTRTVIIAGGLLGMLVLTGTYLAYASRQRNLKRLAQLEVQRLNQDRMIAELRLREQVGRDMHDDLGAGLSALKLKSEMALRQEKDPDKRSMLLSLANTAGELIGNMRQIIWTMSTDQGSLEDLVVYIGNYARTYLDANGLAFDLSGPDRWPAVDLSTEQRRNLFLVIKESLHNIVKHARASRVTLEFTSGDGLGMVVTDDGIGLPRHADLGVGNGLRNMARRIEGMGGTFHMEGLAMENVGSGTRMRIFVPLYHNKGSIAEGPPAVGTSPS